MFRREPTLEEIEEAKKDITSHEASVVSIQQQVAELKIQISHLLNQQHRHLRWISYHKGVATLARRIPPEVLAKIFEHCVSYGWTRAPVTVSHVCSQWREATKIYPRIWSTIYVDVDSAEAIGRTRFWLSRAAKAPLNIVLLATWRATNSRIMDAMDILLRHADQWKTFTLDMTTLHHIQTVTSLCSHASSSFPLLGDICFKTEVHSDEQGGTDSIDLHSAFDPQRAPNVIVFTLDASVLPMNMTYPQNIRFLDLSIKESTAQHTLSAISLITLLRSFPALVQLSLSMPLRYESPYMYEEDLDQIASLEYLDSLTLYGPTNLNHLLAHIRAPSLRELHLRSLEDKGFRQEPVGPSLVAFIRNSENLPRTLECLELHDIDLSPSFFEYCFKTLRNLRELRLHESSISDRTLASLNGDSLGGLCPSLSILDLRWCGYLSGRAIVNLVRSRNHNDPIDASSSTSFDVDIPTTAAREATLLEQRQLNPITQITIINCCFVRDQDIFDLASSTRCRVIPREGDYCGKF